MDNQGIDSQQKQFFALFANHSQYVLSQKHDKYHTFRIVGFDAGGAGIFESIDATCAKYVKEVPLEQKQAYFHTLPSIHLIMSYETDRGWMCYPFIKLDEADPLYDLQSEVLVKNVVGCDRFDTISARYDGMHFWFDSKITSDNESIKAQAMRLCLRHDLTPERMKYNIDKINCQLTQEDRKAFSLAVQAWLIFQRQPLAERQFANVVQSDGSLGSYVVHDIDTNVRFWQEANYKYDSVVDNELLGVTCIGIDMVKYASIIVQSEREKHE